MHRKGNTEGTSRVTPNAEARAIAYLVSRLRSASASPGRSPVLREQRHEGLVAWLLEFTPDVLDCFRHQLPDDPLPYDGPLPYGLHRIGREPPQVTASRQIAAPRGQLDLGDFLKRGRTPRGAACLGG
jgi:hypothetical protein